MGGVVDWSALRCPRQQHCHYVLFLRTYSDYDSGPRWKPRTFLSPLGMVIVSACLSSLVSIASLLLSKRGVYVDESLRLVAACKAFMVGGKLWLSNEVKRSQQGLYVPTVIFLFASIATYIIIVGVDVKSLCRSQRLFSSARLPHVLLVCYAMITLFPTTQAQMSLVQPWGRETDIRGVGLAMLVANELSLHLDSFTQAPRRGSISTKESIRTLVSFVVVDHLVVLFQQAQWAWHNVGLTLGARFWVVRSNGFIPTMEPKEDCYGTCVVFIIVYLCVVALPAIAT